MSKSEINLDVDAPDKVTSVLTAAATAYPASAVEFSAAWQDRYIPMIWAAIASELDIAAWRRSSSTGSTGSIPQYGGKSNGRVAPPAAVEGARGVGALRSDGEPPMGQYHHPIFIEAEEGLNAYDFDVGAKEGEIGFSRPSPVNAMVALVCARGGNMPADCSQSPLIGRWAGKQVLVQGDYAEDDDIPGWQGPPLSRLYHAMETVDGRTPEELDPAHTPFFKDISREARDFLEAVCNVRYFDYEQKIKDGATGRVIDSWTSTGMVSVRPLARTYGDSGIAEYVLSPEYSEEDLAWLKSRKHLRPQDVMRPPRTGDWHRLPRTRSLRAKSA